MNAAPAFAETADPLDVDFRGASLCGSGERYGDAVVGSAVLGEDRVRVGGGPVEPQAGAGPDGLARPFRAAVRDRTAGERLDPAGGLAVLEHSRGRGHVHALP